MLSIAYANNTSQTEHGNGEQQHRGDGAQQTNIVNLAQDQQVFFLKHKNRIEKI